ncbi:MAG: metalloregulator ArsR/SmtB family transcription factor [Candidatus Spechtbacterales bacterium]|nr:metalloregulator ArsR/SmtB family transcription factor [Candidatus Spechtbacterales bacterium]
MAQKNKIQFSEEELTEKARIFAMAGDEVRLKILCYLFEGGEPCVSEISEKIGKSIAATSHHLQLMQQSGLLYTERKGNNICYKFNENKRTKELKKIICEL